MARNSRETHLENILKTALNPIGSLALCERVEAKSEVLGAVFRLLSPSAIVLTLSPYGYRLIECFLNAKKEDFNARLGEIIGESWSTLGQMMQSLRGRHVCQTLLNRGVKTLAHSAIKLTPIDWWFCNVDSMPILVKAIEISDLAEANAFLADDSMIDNLAESADGLYCVLKVMERTMDQDECKTKFELMILRISKSISGVTSLKEVIIYGDILTGEIVNIICSLHESYENGITYSLIIFLIRTGSGPMRELIFNCLCSPDSFPLICSLRSCSRYKALTGECEKIFTEIQRNKLHACLDAHPEENVNEEQPMEESVGNQNLKRKSNLPTTSDATAKKPRADVDSSRPSTSIGTVLPPTVSTVPPSPTPTVTTPTEPMVSLSPVVATLPPSPTPTVTPPTEPTVSPVVATVTPTPTVLPPTESTVSPVVATVSPTATALPSTESAVSPVVATVPSRPIHPRVSAPTVSHSVVHSPTGIIVTIAPSTEQVESVTNPSLSPTTVSLPILPTVSPVGCSPADITPPSSTPPSLPTVILSTEGHTGDRSILVEKETTVSATLVTGKSGVAPVKATTNRSKRVFVPDVDPGEDMLALAMSEKGNRTIMRNLEKGTKEMKAKIFSCIQNGVILLSMDERGCKVTEWFLCNGTSSESSMVEAKIIDNIEVLVESGGYGRSLVRLIIDRCGEEIKKKELEEKYEMALNSIPMEDAKSFPPSIQSNPEEEVEVLSENIMKNTMETRALHQLFSQVDYRLNNGTLNYRAANEFMQSAILDAALKDDSLRLNAISVIGREIDKWLSREQGCKFITLLLQHKLWRVLLVNQMSLHLHRLLDEHLKLLFAARAKTEFIDACLKGGSRSPLVTLFSHGYRGQKIAYQFINIDRPKITRFLSDHSDDICLFNGGRDKLVKVMELMEGEEVVSTPAIRRVNGRIVREKKTDPSPTDPYVVPRSIPTGLSATGPSAPSAIQQEQPQITIRSPVVPQPTKEGEAKIVSGLPPISTQSTHGNSTSAQSNEKIAVLSTPCLPPLPPLPPLSSHPLTLGLTNVDKGKIPSLLNLSFVPKSKVKPSFSSTSINAIKESFSVYRNPQCSTDQKKSVSFAPRLDPSPEKIDSTGNKQKFTFSSSPSPFGIFDRSVTGNATSHMTEQIPNPFRPPTNLPNFSFKTLVNTVQSSTKFSSFNDYVIDKMVKDTVDEMMAEVVAKYP